MYGALCFHLSTPTVSIFPSRVEGFCAALAAGHDFLFLVLSIPHKVSLTFLFGRLLCVQLCIMYTAVGDRRRARFIFPNSLASHKK